MILLFSRKDIYTPTIRLDQKYFWSNLIVVKYTRFKKQV